MTIKSFINSALAICSTFAAVPTGWAIYAGVTKQPAFPMNPIAAGVGAVAVVLVDIAAGLLVTDILTFNKSLKNKTEREQFSMSTLRAWLILITAIIAEIVLSLVVVVVDGALAYGVAVFPVLTGAGVFAFAVRMDLQEREALRDELREKSKRTTTHSAETPQHSEAPAPAVLSTPKGWPKKCEWCDEFLKSPQAKGGHMKKHHPEKCMQKAYPYTPIEKAKVER